MKNYHNEQGVCPYCGSTNLNYLSHECYDDNRIFFYYECNDCGKDGQEYYTMEFKAHLIYDDDDNQIEL